MRKTLQWVSMAAILGGLSGAPLAQTGTQVYETMGLKPQQVLSGTVLNTRVMPGEAKQVAAVVTYLTGKKGADDAVNVRLELFSAAESESNAGPGVVPPFWGT